MGMTRVRNGLELVRSGEGRRGLSQATRTRLYSRRGAIGLRRDLTVPFAVPQAKIPLTVRPLRADDDLTFIADQPDLDPDLAQARLRQRWLLTADLPTCWIAIDDDGAAAYMQWLIAPEHNDRIREWWGGLFPELKPGEALLEGAYTSDSHRGKGVMSHAMARIAEHAADFGARHVITFVGHENIASLKGCERSGFSPYIERRDSWSLFHRNVSFQPLT
jgi:GNAT superfamily N-acetyltransferase